MGRDMPDAYRNRPRSRGDDGDEYGRPSGERSARGNGPRSDAGPRSGAGRSLPPSSGGRSLPPGGAGGRTSGPGNGGGNGGGGGFIRRPGGAAGGDDDGRRSGPSPAYGRGASGDTPRRDTPRRDTRMPARRDAGDDSPAYMSGERPRSRRPLAELARDASRSMSRQLSSVVSRVGRAARELEGPPPRRLGSPPPPRTSMPDGVAAQLDPKPYRRSRARVIATKWRRGRVRPNPIGYAVGAMVVVLLVLVVLVGGGAGSVYATSYYNAHIGEIQAVANLSGNTSTEILDRYGQLIYVVKGGDSNFNFYVPLNQMTPLIQWATIDTEDRTFYSNPGIDVAGTLRAALTDARAGGAASQGGSGITQQLVKLLVLNDTSKALQRKINEAILSVGMTVGPAGYSKAQILEMYLNEIDYGDQNTGIEAAARNYFGYGEIPDPDPTKPAKAEGNQQLTLAQAAILAGVPNAPTIYRPNWFSCDSAPCPMSKWDNPFVGDPKNCGAHIASFGPNWYLDPTHGHEWLVYCRAMTVLGNMENFGTPGLNLTKADYEKARADVVSILENQQVYHWKGRTGNTSNSAASSANRAPHFVEYVTQILADEFGLDHLDSAGVRVTTTLDLSLQDEVQKDIHYYLDDHYMNNWYGCKTGAPPPCADIPLSSPYNGNAHNGAAVAVDQHTGDILAMVGSADYNSKDPQVLGANNVATAYRSMGSATKPIIYATAFQMGWTPGVMMQDVPICFPGGGLTDPTTKKPVQHAQAPACDGYYAPTNYEANNFSGTFPLRRNFDDSLNIAATEAMEFVGGTAYTAENVMRMATRLGISTCPKGHDDPTQCKGWKYGAVGPTTALGGQETPLIQLAGAYSTFANGGKRNPNRAILKIERKKDNQVLWQAGGPPNTPVLSPQAAYMVTNVLTDNFARYPYFKFNNPLHLEKYPTMEVAAKTGTSSGINGPRDIITSGYTPYMTLSVWIGNTDASDLNSNIIGIAGAGYIFHDVMQFAADHYKWNPDAKFPVPSGLAYANFNCDTGLAPYKDAKDADMKCAFRPYTNLPKDVKNGAYDVYNPDGRGDAPQWIFSGSGYDYDLYMQNAPWVNS